MRSRIRSDWKRNKSYYFIVLPVVLYFIVFKYVPMGGLIMAFQNYKPAMGLTGSPWVGLDNFVQFFSSYYFTRLLGNTLILSLLGLIFGTLGPLCLALIINEIGHKHVKKAVQTTVYLPYFISMVVVASLIKIFVAPEGPIGGIASYFAAEPVNMLAKPEYFRAIIVCSDLWQMGGYYSVIYLSAISTVDMQQYEAAVIDGAGRWRQLFSITLPSIAPTIIVLLIMRLGQVLNVGIDKIILLYSPAVYETADVISTFVYRKGLIEADYSYATAVGLFNSVVGMIMVVLANKVSKKVSETSLF